jgi:hypothetical protein
LIEGEEDPVTRIEGRISDDAKKKKGRRGQGHFTNGGRAWAAGNGAAARKPNSGSACASERGVGARLVERGVAGALAVLK